MRRTFFAIWMVVVASVSCSEVVESPPTSESVEGPTSPKEQKDALTAALEESRANEHWVRAEAAHRMLARLEDKRALPKAGLTEIQQRRAVQTRLLLAQELVERSSERAAEHILRGLAAETLTANEKRALDEIQRALHASQKLKATTRP